MTTLITGAAGFIGYHTAQRLLAAGERVVGVDNLNDYYDVALKEARVARLLAHDGFSLITADISDKDAMADVAQRHGDIDVIIHLAAQAGVRYSLINPYAYTQCNVEGHLVLMEMARALKRFRHFVYASSSSVYGANTKLPFSVDDPVNHPVSLYAATKRSMELMSESYSRMYGLPMTGLRFFTVYGPWGRPDMAAYIFTHKIIAGEPIEVFNDGDMRRDFTYIDDIVSGILGCAANDPKRTNDGVAHQIYNLGNHRSEPLMRFIQVLEQSLQRKADIQFKPMQNGDVKETYADIEASRRDFGFEPATGIDEGIPNFVDWYKDYHGV